MINKINKMKTLIFLVLMCCACGAVLASKQCCPNGYRIMRKSGCENDEGNTTSTNLSCPYGKFVLRDIRLQGNKVLADNANSYVFVEDPNLYCIGEAYRNWTEPELGLTPSAVICFDPVEGGIEVTGMLTLVSVVFLLFTLAVYLYLPQMRDLQGLCYISMCISMALGYLSLGILQISPGFKGEFCTVTGFMVYFWLMATFFWMNVISINIYRSIEDPSYLKKTERQQYFKYSCYSWGTTVMFLIVALCTNFIEGNHWKPGIGESSCWFRGAPETWIFFYGPVAILVTCNIGLFVISSLKLWRQKKNYEVDKLNNMKHKFLLSLKLFLVMGISWIFEIASFAHGKSNILWKITDIFNCLQGVVIFVLLVLLRRRAMQGLASENICLPISRPLADKLSPHDDEDEQQVLGDDTMEVRLNY